MHTNDELRADANAMIADAFLIEAPHFHRRFPDEGRDPDSA
jgi:hypothetical protein